MKKILSIILVLALMFSFTACSSEPKTDLDYVKEKGVLTVGITNFEPMDYPNENGEWIGFDADLAKAFAESIGVKAEFVEIEWSNKVLELDGKTIDCVWNGMTLTEEVKSAMNTSNPYFNNAQVLIVKADVVEKYKTEKDLTKLAFAVEDGSAGMKEVEALGLTFTPVLSQADALMEVSAGTCDAAVIDLLMAMAMIGEGTSYEDLTYSIHLNSEEYGVGFRKESNLTEKLNEFFVKSYKDGQIQKIAEEYGIADAVIEQ